METMYWLITLGELSGVCLAFSIATGVLSAVLLGFLIFGIKKEENPTYYCWTEKGYKTGKICFKILISIFFISFIGSIFIPTTNQLYAIYGIGGSYDYLKSNPTAKKLPDKCIKILDKWADKELKDSIK